MKQFLKLYGESKKKKKKKMQYILHSLAISVPV